MSRRVRLWAVLLSPVLLSPVGGAKAWAAEGEAYDPLRLAAGAEPATHDLSFDDAQRKRTIPLKAYLPKVAAGEAAEPAPVVLFSHGLGGSREGGAYLGKHWGARGYVVVAMQHAGSDSEVWRNAPLGERRNALSKAAGGENFLLRAKDVAAVLDQLTKWNGAAGHVLAGRLDLEHVGMSGHSFGAVTTQAVSGQSFPLGGGAALTDARIDAAVLFSPSPPRAGSAEKAFGSVRLPWLLMTGTKDDSPIGGITAASRLEVFPALPAGAKYELVLDGAEHSAFGDRGPLADRGRPNDNHHRVILALGTAFWDAYLRGDAAAKTWLDGAGPRSVLETADRWRTK